VWSPNLYDACGPCKKDKRNFSHNQVFTGEIGKDLSSLLDGDSIVVKHSCHMLKGGEGGGICWWCRI
jgi:hypothetical protein